MSRTSADIKREIKEIQAYIDTDSKKSARLTEYANILKQNVVKLELKSEDFVDGDHDIMNVINKSFAVIVGYIDNYEDNVEGYNERICDLQKDLSITIEEEKKLSKLINFSLPISKELIKKMGLQVIPTPISKEQLQNMEDKKEAEKIADGYKHDALMVMICQLTEDDIPEVSLIGLEIILMAEILKRTDHGAAFVKAIENSFGKLANAGGNATDIRNLLSSYLSGM